MRAAEDSGELRALQMLAQPGLFSTVADDEEAEVVHSVAAKLLLYCHQQCDIFLDGEAADEAENEVSILRATIAICGRERLGIDTTRHQVTGAAGRAFKQCAQLGVGREEHARLLVIEGGAPKRCGFDLPANTWATSAEETREPTGTRGGILVHIGVPGGDQRHAQMVRDPCADEAQLRRTGDVNDVWPKVPRVSEDARQMPPVREIESQVLLYRKGECAARQLERADGAVFVGAIGRTCAHTEKGQAAAAGKGHKVPAGVRYAIDLVKGVGKVCDSRQMGE